MSADATLPDWMEPDQTTPDTDPLRKHEAPRRRRARRSLRLKARRVDLTAVSLLGVPADDTASPHDRVDAIDQTPEPVVEPVSESASEAVVEPVAEPIDEPLTEPIDLTPPSEAPSVLSQNQKFFAGLCVVAVGGGLVLTPLVTVVVLNAALVVFFMASNSMKLFLISRALNNPCELKVDVEANRTPDDELPVYTILLPDRKSVV